MLSHLDHSDVKAALLKGVSQDFVERQLIIALHRACLFHWSDQVAPRLPLADSSVHVEDREYMGMADHKYVVVDQELREELHSVLVRVQQSFFRLYLGLGQRQSVHVEKEHFVSISDEEEVDTFTHCVSDCWPL